MPSDDWATRHPELMHWLHQAEDELGGYAPMDEILTPATILGFQERWCPSIACIKEQRSDVDRSRVEPGVKVAWHAIAQQDFHGPRRVCHPCQYSWAIQPLTGMRLWESNYPRRGRTSREAISALRHADRRRHPLTARTDGALGRGIVSRASGG